MVNTIILLKGEIRLTSKQFLIFEKGSTIFGNDSAPEELSRWVMEDKEEALRVLAEYKCTYKKWSELVCCEEYALMYCETDEEGEFVSGSDFDLAEEE